MVPDTKNLILDVPYPYAILSMSLPLHQNPEVVKVEGYILHIVSTSLWVETWTFAYRFFFEICVLNVFRDEFEPGSI